MEMYPHKDKSNNARAGTPLAKETCQSTCGGISFVQNLNVNTLGWHARLNHMTCSDFQAQAGF